MKITEALAILSDEPVYFFKITQGGGSAAYQRDRRSFTGRVRRRKGEGLDSMLVRLVEAMMAAKSDNERWRAAEARRDAREVKAGVPLSRAMWKAVATAQKLPSDRATTN